MAWGGLLLVLLLSCPAAPPPCAAQQPNAERFPPFLEVFLHRDHPEVLTRNVTWTSALGRERGLLAYQQTVQTSVPDPGSRFLAENFDRAAPRSPALVVIPGRDGADPPLRRCARELADIGFVVLLVEIDGNQLAAAAENPLDLAGRERLLVRLTSAVRWLRSRSDVFGDRIGAIGWGAGGYWAGVLASATGLQAAVNCDGPLSNEPAVLAGLGHCAVLGVWGRGHLLPEPRRTLDTYQTTLQSAGIEHHFLEFPDAGPGFMFPESGAAYRHDDAEQAWFEIYEFLGHHAEDAHLKELRRGPTVAGLQPPAPPTATIAELMRAVNTPTGVRGALALSLGDEPDSDAAWKTVRARAVLLAESADLLERLDPPKGTATSWRKHLAAYRTAAQSIAKAADTHDYPAARDALKPLSTACADCHRDHR